MNQSRLDQLTADYHGTRCMSWSDLAELRQLQQERIAELDVEVANRQEAHDIVSSLDEPARQRLADVTVRWPGKNRRRCELIHREIGGRLSPEEAVELERLQQLIDLQLALVAPRDFGRLALLKLRVRESQAALTEKETP